jgi:hypothetical protein
MNEVDLLAESFKKLEVTANRIADERNALMQAAKLTIGFCVAFREDVPDWERFPQVGQLFARVTAILEGIKR